MKASTIIRIVYNVVWCILCTLVTIASDGWWVPGILLTALICCALSAMEERAEIEEDQS